jgi:methyl-accepting chemotaxis protein
VHVKIRTKLLAVAAIPVILLSAVGVYSLRGLGDVAHRSHAAYVNFVAPMVDLGEVRYAIGEIRANFDETYAGVSDGARRSLAADSRLHLRTAETMLRKFAQHELSAPEAARLPALRRQWEMYRAATLRALAQVEAGDVAAARVRRVERRELAGELRSKLTALIQVDELNAKQHVAKANTTYSSVKLFVLVGLLLAVAGSVVAIFLVARKAGRTIRELVVAAERIGAGDLTGSVDVESNDELVYISRAIEQMRVNLVGVLSSVVTGTQELTQVAIELRASAREGAAATTEQSAALAQTSATVAQLAATADSIADYSRGIASAADNTGETMRAMQDRVEAIASRSVHLGERSQRIGQILDVMNGIAEQTNLLALNAAIEAARAGDAGRGFAVVAGEVRKLAERSIHSADSIREIIAGLQDETNATIMATEQGAKNAREVGLLMDETSTMLEESILATQQQKTAADQVAVALSQVRDAAGQLAADQSQRALTSERIEALANELQLSLVPFRTRSAPDLVAAA